MKRFSASITLPAATNTTVSPSVTTKSPALLAARGPMAAALAALLLASPLLASPALADSAASAPESSSAQATGAKAANNPTLEEFSQVGTIEQTVLVDEAGIKITATGLTYTDYAVELNLLIENNTEQDLEFLGSTLGYAINSVNGVMVGDGYLSCDVAAGKKANDTMSFSYDNLMTYGITEIADIEVGIYTSDGDWQTEDFYSGPRRVQTQLASSYDYATDAYQQAIASKELQERFEYTVPSIKTDVLYDQAGVTLLSQALIVNRDGEPALMLELVNNSPDIVRVTTSDISINGLQVYGSGTWSGDSIAPGKRCVVDLRLSRLLEDAFWDAYGLSDVASVGLTLGLKNANGDPLVEPTPLALALTGGVGGFNPNGAEVYNNGAGLRIVYKGLIDSPESYSSGVYALFLVENTSGQPIDASIDSSSGSANGFMLSMYSWSARIPDGCSSAAIAQIMGSSLEDNGIASAGEITDLGLTFELRTPDYVTIDEPTLAISPTTVTIEPVAPPQSEATPANAGNDATVEQVEAAAAGVQDPVNGTQGGGESAEAAASDGDAGAAGTTPETGTDSSAVTPEFKTMMDEYETFMNGYVDFVISYTSSDDMLGMLADYTSLVKQEVVWVEKVDAIDQATLTAADAAYYVEVTARVSQRLLEIA